MTNGEVTRVAPAMARVVMVITTIKAIMDMDKTMVVTVVAATIMTDTTRTTVPGVATIRTMAITVAMVTTKISLHCNC